MQNGAAKLTTRALLPLTETEDGSGTRETEKDQEETMKRIRKDFSRSHAMSIHLNAIGMIATVWYGIGLASKIRFIP